MFFIIFNFIEEVVNRPSETRGYPADIGPCTRHICADAVSDSLNCSMSMLKLYVHVF